MMESSSAPEEKNEESRKPQAAFNFLMREPFCKYKNLYKHMPWNTGMFHTPFPKKSPYRLNFQSEIHAMLKEL